MYTIPIVLVVVQQNVYKQIVGGGVVSNWRVFGLKTNCGDVVVWSLSLYQVSCVNC